MSAEDDADRVLEAARILAGEAPVEPPIRFEVVISAAEVNNAIREYVVAHVLRKGIYVKASTIHNATHARVQIEQYTSEAHAQNWKGK